MSEENVDLTEQLIQAFNRRDLAAMTERFDPEIEWTPGGPAAVERAVYRGRDAVSDGFAATWETWISFHLEQHEIRDLSDATLRAGARPTERRRQPRRARPGVRHPPPDGRWKDRSNPGLPAWQEASKPPRE